MHSSMVARFSNYGKHIGHSSKMDSNRNLKLNAVTTINILESAIWSYGCIDLT